MYLLVFCNYDETNRQSKFGLQKVVDKHRHDDRNRAMFWLTTLA